MQNWVYKMYFFNPYPTNYKSSPLEVKRLLPLLELIWNGDRFDIIYGIPYINDQLTEIKEAKPIVTAIAHLLEAPITLLENKSPSIKGKTGGSFSSQTLHHTDLNKDTIIGQTFNGRPTSKTGKASKHFGCNAKQKNSAFQKLWRRCGFPEPKRWSRPSLSIIGTKFLTGHLTTYKKTGNLKYKNETVETVFFTNEQILEALPISLKVEKGNTDLKQILHRNDTTPSQLLPIYDTLHLNKHPPDRTIITGLERGISACSNKRISHLQSQGGSTKSYIYDKYAELDGSPF